MKARVILSILAAVLPLAAVPTLGQTSEKPSSAAKQTASEATTKPASHIPERPAPNARRAPLSGEQLAAKIQERALKGIWWNQENKLTKVPLSDEKRAQMDDLLKAYLTRREQARKARRVNDFADALEKGDWAAAEKAAELQADAAAQEHRERALWTIEVIRLLSAKERQALQENFPMLLRRDWMPQMTQRNRARGNFRRGQ